MKKGTHYKTQEQFKTDVFDGLNFNGTLQLGDSAKDFSECLDAWTQQGIDNCGVRFNTRVYPAQGTIARWFREYRARFA